jgi:hypothetical protein
MKSTEFKKLLKPLIREAIKEVIFEEGILSGLISEVVRGVSPPQQVQTIERPPSQAPIPMMQESQGKVRQQIKETREKLLQAVGQDAYNGIDIFEGVQPLRSTGTSGGPQVTSPLSNYEPGDSGVDISGLFSNKWKHLV